jgi:hypothetical protein
MSIINLSAPHNMNDTTNDKKIAFPDVKLVMVKIN